MDKWLQRIRTMLEILAIVVGGWWVWSRFLIGDLPSLDPRIKVESTLRWSPIVEGSCLGEYEVSFRNIGKVTVKVEEAKLTVALVDPAAFLNPLQVLDPTEGVHRVVYAPPPRDLAGEEWLGGSYAPDEGTTAGTTVRVKHVAGRIVLFRLAMRVSDAAPHGILGRVVGPLVGFGVPDRTKPWPDHRWRYSCEQSDRVANKR